MAPGTTVADRRTATECWHLVVTKVTDSLHDAPLFLLSLNFNETAVVGDVIVSVVELLHQLALVTTEELVEHLANQLRLNVVKHQLVLELVEAPGARCAHGHRRTCSCTVSIMN